jgi:hypothetical protein
MSFKQKNITVTFVNFSLILVFFLFRVFQMVQNDSFTSENVFRLWGIIIILAVVVSIGATILTIIVSAVIDAIRTGKEEPEIDALEDERDKLIDLRGTKITNLVSSIGSLIAMLTFVLGQPPLVMFTLLIFFGVLAQVVGDISRLVLYQRGA